MTTSSTTGRSQRSPTVFMMDLWATVPYYTAYLSRALLQGGTKVIVGSITYYLDPACFSSRGLRPDPGVLDIVGRFPLPKLPRRILKLAEALVNLAGLTVRFLVSPIDIIHVQYLPMLLWRVPLDLWFLKLMRWRGSRVVVTVHDLLPHDTADRYRETFHRLYHQADGIICHSDSIKARLVHEFLVPPQNISVIPHGPFFYDLPDSPSRDTRVKFDVPEGQRLVLWQGIIFPYKGVDLLLEAWAQVEKEEAAVTLLIVGTGRPDLIREIEQQIRRFGLQQVVFHPHFISPSDLVALYRAADVIVYPYRAITTSGALATGLALGKAIIASDLPVFRELLTAGENALLFDPLNTDELAVALLDLLQHPDRREELCLAVRGMNFGDRVWSSLADQTVAAYQRALA